MFKKSLILGVISFFAGVFLSFTYILTKPIIAQQKLNAEQESISLLLPNVSRVEKKEDEGMVYYRCYDNGELIGYALIASIIGYSSEIKIMVAIDKHKMIKGIKVLEQQETPGLGAKIAESWFEDQFKEKKIEDLIIGKGIDAISGATISSKAVTDATKKVIEKFSTD